MTLTIALPTDYSYVLAVASSSFLVATYNYAVTGWTRKAAKVPYPNAYASQEQADKDRAAFKFNCAQRVQANFAENHTAWLGALLISGLRFPLTSAGLGATWIVARLLYSRGYTSDKGPQGRSAGAGVGFVSDTILRFMAVFTSFSLALNW